MTIETYLFIRQDSMQPRGYDPLEKKKKYLEEGRTNNPKVIPSPIEQVQKTMQYCRSQCSRVKKQLLFRDALPQYRRLLAATGASREGSFVVRINRHGSARFLLAK